MTSCSSSSSTHVGNWTKVHEWINERTFTIGRWDKTTSYLGFGTCWLFYHLTSSSDYGYVDGDNYQYYALTNFHVGSMITNVAYPSNSRCEIYFGYQTSDEAQDNAKRINHSSLNDYGKSAGSNQLNVFDGYENGQHKYDDDGFDALFTEYISVNNNQQFFDMEVIKLDFGDAVTWKNSDALKTRLNNLNDYATNNNNYTIPFMSTNSSDSESYQEINNKISDNKNVSIYTGGYPLEDLGGDDIYTDGTYKFQYQTFGEARKTEIGNPPFIDKISLEDDGGAMNYYPLNRNLSNFKNTYTVAGYDYTSYQTNSKIAFGAGASGSLAIYAADPDDASTYRAMGIYWGEVYNNSGTWFKTCFSPFWINWGDAIKNGSTTYRAATNNTFINDFFDNMSNLPEDLANN